MYLFCLMALALTLTNSTRTKGLKKLLTFTKTKEDAIKSSLLNSLLNNFSFLQNFTTLERKLIDANTNSVQSTNRSTYPLAPITKLTLPSTAGSYHCCKRSFSQRQKNCDSLESITSSLLSFGESCFN